MCASADQMSMVAFTDEEILKGFFFHSRYITKKIYNKYGINVNLYEEVSSKDISMLKERLKELISQNKFKDVNNTEELHKLLGNDFKWVKSI